MSKIITISQTGGPRIDATFDKAMLKLLPTVSSHGQLSSESAWGMVAFIYKHTLSSKKLAVAFKGNFDSQSSMKIRSGMNSGDEFELKRIIISGPGRQPKLVLSRSQIENVAQLDFALGSGGGSGGGGESGGGSGGGSGSSNMVFSSFDSPTVERERVRFYGGGFNLSTAESTYSVGELQRFTMSGTSGYLQKVSIGAWLGNQFGGSQQAMSGASFKFVLYAMNGDNLETIMPGSPPMSLGYSDSRSYNSLVSAGVQEMLGGASPSGDGTEIEFNFNGVFLTAGQTYALGLVIEVAVSAEGASYGASMHVAHKDPASGFGGIFNYNQYGSIPASPNYKMKVYTA